MGREWIDVCITSQADAGELLGFLDNQDVAGAWQENGQVHLYWPADRWSPALVEALQQALRRLGPESEQPVMQIAAVPDRDWNEQGGRTVKPIRIGRRFVIRPSWASADEVALAQAFADAGGVVRSWREREGWLALDLLAPESCEGTGA